MFSNYFDWLFSKFSINFLISSFFWFIFEDYSSLLLFNVSFNSAIIHLFEFNSVDIFTIVISSFSLILVSFLFSSFYSPNILKSSLILSFKLLICIFFSSIIFDWSNFKSTNWLFNSKLDFTKFWFSSSFYFIFIV